MRRIALLLGGLALAGGALAQEAAPGDPEAGRALVGPCRTCHGTDGLSRIPQAPHIAGQPESYLAAQLQAFHDGVRQQEMMTIVSQGLTPGQIADLSAWYASQKVTATLKADPSGAPEACVACHGADGISVVEDVPHLAGHANVYILAQLKAFADGTRPSEVMQPIASELSPADARAAADWYAAITLKAAAE
jgi:cytochrome c553